MIINKVFINIFFIFKKLFYTHFNNHCFLKNTVMDQYKKMFYTYTQR